MTIETSNGQFPAPTAEVQDANHTNSLLSMIGEAVNYVGDQFPRPRLPRKVVAMLGAGAVVLGAGGLTESTLETSPAGAEGNNPSLASAPDPNECGDRAVAIPPLSTVWKLNEGGTRVKVTEAFEEGAPFNCLRMGDRTIKLVVYREGDDHKMHKDSAPIRFAHGNDLQSTLESVVVNLRKPEDCLPGPDKRALQALTIQTYTPNSKIADNAGAKVVVRKFESSMFRGSC